MVVNHEPDLQRFGALIASRRRDLAMTQDELAQRVGWSQERISTIERGRYGLPSLPSLARLATALDIPLSELLGAAGFPAAPTISPETQSSASVLLYALERLLEVDGTDMHQVFDQTCTILGEALQADKVDVFLLEASTRMLVAVGTSRTPMGRRQHELGLDRVPLDHGGSIAEVYRTGRVHETGRADEDPGELEGLVHGLGVRSLIELPIALDGAVQGLLVISSAEPERFTPEDRRFTEAAGRWIAVIMHRAELWRQLEQLRG
jgi:transcriptional regulator with XRE-family HTH domain